MSNRNCIRVAEFEKLYYDDSKPFKQKHWEALCRYQELQKKNQDGNEYFRILNKGIQFTNYVGAIQAGNLTIEVLPKTDRSRTTAENCSIDLLAKDEAVVRQSWHNVLLQMLKECSLLQVNHVDYANLRLKANSILEIYLELFLEHTERLLHEGLIKKYRRVEGNRFEMKGQLLFGKNISQNIVHKERFYVRYTEYNRTNIFNQLLYKTLCHIHSISNNSLLTDKVNRLLLNFPEMPDCAVTPFTFDKLVYDRKSERYKEAMHISKMLLLNYRPDITGGSENVMAILFDMNKLWEEFVYRRLKKAAGGDTEVSRQNKRDFWHNHTNSFNKQIRPDIVITKGTEKIVLDTKWKVIQDNRPGDDDLKQMFVYNLLWNAEKSFLIYPGDYEPCHGSYYHFKLSKDGKEVKNDTFVNSCSLAFITVLNEDGKLAGLAPFSTILEKL